MGPLEARPEASAPASGALARLLAAWLLDGASIIM